MLPSVPSLSALRKLAPVPLRRAIRSSAWAIPSSRGDPAEPPAWRPQARGRGNPARFYRSGLADVRAVRELTPLPDTADELRTIAKVLGAPPDAINLREAASETHA